MTKRKKFTKNTGTNKSKVNKAVQCAVCNTYILNIFIVAAAQGHEVQCHCEEIQSAIKKLLTTNYRFRDEQRSGHQTKLLALWHPDPSGTS